MPTIAELIIKVDTSQVDKAKKDVQGLADAASNIKPTVKGVSGSLDEVSKASDKLSSSSSALEARAKKLVETFGMGKGEVLKYDAAIKGVSSSVDPLADRLTELISTKKADVEATKAAAQVQRAAQKSIDGSSAAQYKLIESLREQIALFGKSKDEVILYRAGLMGISDQVGPLVAELNRLKQAKDEEAQAGLQERQTAVQRRQAEKQALAEQEAEVRKLIALERERVSQAQSAGNISEQEAGLKRLVQLEHDRAKALNSLDNATPAQLRRIEASEKALQRYRERLDSLSTSQQAGQKSSADFANEFRKLSAAIDPATESLRRLDEQQDALNREFSRKGTSVTQQEYTRLNGIIENSRKRISDLGATTGKTAKEINFAMRGLPAQFTDIFVSLQGGQAPLTVFLQQGGQIKDMFGGIGPAFRAMAGYVMSLISPLTVAAAAIGTLGLGFVLGSRESSSFNKSLIATGNAAGSTATAFLDLQTALDDSITTSGKAATVLNQIAATGKITETSFDRIARAAILWEKATGTATEETVANFAKLRGDPVNAVEELDEKYNFLTASTYQQIAALQEQGKTSEATAIAERELANAFIERSRDIEKNLGLVESAWAAVAGAAKEGWDAILDIGRQQSPTKKLQDLYSLLDDYQSAGVSNETTRRLLLEVTNLQAEIGQAEEKALDDRIDKKIKDEGIAGQKFINSLKTRAEKEKDELVKLDKSIADARRSGVEVTEKEIEDARSAIREKYARRQPKATVVREDAATKLLATMRQQEASLNNQLQSNTKLGTQEQAYARLQQQISDIEVKAKTEVLTKEQQSLLANKEALLAQQAKNVAVEKEIKDRQELVKLQATQAVIDQQIANDRQRYQDALIGTTSSDKEAERMRERNRLEQEYQRQLQQLARQRNAGEISQGNYEANVQAYKSGLDERKAILEQHYKDLDSIQSDWTVGAEKAWNNYLEAGKDVAGLTQSFFTNSFNTMEDALVGFITTGKLSFKDLAVSILSDLAKIATKAAITSAAMAAFGGGAGGGGLGAAISSIFQADGGGWNKGTQFFAKGGAFTNSVVSSPTAFGTGSGLGVMGEAGPEAIMPLTRTSDGQLGVKAAGGGGSTVVAPVSVTVHVTDSGGSNTSNNSTEQQGRAVQMAIKSEVEKTIQIGLQPGGILWKAMNNR